MESDDLQPRVRESLDLVEADLRELVGRVGGSADRVHESIGSANQELDAIGVSTAGLSGLAELASENVATLASATEELAQSASDIGRQITAATDFTENASAPRAVRQVTSIVFATARAVSAAS